MLGPQACSQNLHAYLMGKKFPYHSVSVVYYPIQRCYFMESVKEMITEDVKKVIEVYGFDYVIVKH